MTPGGYPGALRQSVTEFERNADFYLAGSEDGGTMPFNLI